MSYHTTNHLNHTARVQPLRALGLGLGLLVLIPAWSVQAKPTPPRALWSPISASAERSGVSVNFEGDTSEDGRVPIVIANAQPFSVEVRDLEQCRGSEVTVSGQSVRSERCYALPEALVLEANSRVRTSLRFVSHRRTERAGLLGVRFGLDVGPDVAVALEELLGHIDAPDVVWTFEDLRSVQALARFVAAEWGAAGAANYPRDGLEAVLTDTQTLARALPERVCLHERERIRAVGSASGHGPILRALKRFEAFMHHAPPGSPQRGCLDKETLGRVVAAELEHGQLYRAVAIARDFDRGASTPEPFRSALIRMAVDDIKRHRRQADALLAQKAMMELHTFDPDHPVLASWGALMESLSEQARMQASDYAFADAFYALESLSQGVEHLRRAPNRSLPGAEALLRETTAAVAYEQARYQYHYKLHEEGMIATTRQSFRKAEAHAPVATRFYLVGVYFFEHQFTILFTVLVLIGAMILVVRSRAFWRLRIGLGLWQAHALAWSGRRHASREAFWSVLSQVLASTRGAQPDLKLQAQAASGVLEQARQLGEVHEIAEASKHYVGLESLYRPKIWGSPQRLMEAAAQSIPAEGPIDQARLEANRRLMQELFPRTPEARLADALCSEAECRQVWSAHGDLDGAYTEVVTRYEAVLKSAPDAAWAKGVYQRLGVLAAQLGPSAEGPEQAWSRAWRSLQEADQTPWWGVEPELLSVARTMAASAGGTTRDAVEVVQEVLPILQSSPRGQALLRSALLCAARRAQLPLVEPGQPQPPAAEALMALAALDNMITAHVEGPEALDARLRLAILRRLGGAANGHGNRDIEYHDDREELLTLAHTHRHRSTTLALASVLDVLTPGDWGFDDHAETARGAEGALFALLGALDAHVAGRTVEAAAALANADPEADDVPRHRQVRLLAARALVAAAVGQRRSALTALERAAHRAGGGHDARVVDVTAARLVGLLFEGVDSCEDVAREVWTLGTHGALLARACRGFLRSPNLPQPPMSWARMGCLLAEQGQSEAAVLALEHSMQSSAERALAAERGAAWRRLCHCAMLSYDYHQAARYAALAHRESAQGSSTLG